MATEKQIAANRRNALKSTGPRTPAGRAKVGQNAVVHGLTAEQMVIFDESKEDFDNFVSRIAAAWEPVGPIEEELAGQIACGFWRQRRALRAEAALFNDARSHSCGVFQSMIDSMVTFARYSSSIDRKTQYAIDRLERLQARRRGEPVAAPIAMTISGTLNPVEPLCPADEHVEPPKSQGSDGQLSMDLIAEAPTEETEAPVLECKTKPISS